MIDPESSGCYASAYRLTQNFVILNQVQHDSRVALFRTPIRNLFFDRITKQQSNPHPNPLPWRGKASNIIGSNIFTPTPSGEKKFGNNSATCNIIGGILPRPARTTCLMQRQGLALWLLLRLTKLYQLRTPQFYELYLNVHFRLLPQPLCDQSIQQLLSFVPRSYYPA